MDDYPGWWTKGDYGQGFGLDLDILEGRGYGCGMGFGYLYSGEGSGNGRDFPHRVRRNYGHSPHQYRARRPL